MSAARMKKSVGNSLLNLVERDFLKIFGWGGGGGGARYHIGSLKYATEQ